MKTANEIFEAELAALPTRIGERNRRLFALSFKGRTAGLSAEDVIRRIIAASGDPPLGQAEVERAVRKVWTIPSAPHQMTKPPRKTVCVYRPEKRRGNPRLTNLLADAVSPPRPQSRQIPSDFVREMIGLGGGEASSADLIGVSPVPIRKEPNMQALDFCVVMDEPDSEFFFLGNPRQKRTRERLYRLDEIECGLAFGDLKNLPTHILPNDLTGNPALNERGEESYALEACLAHRRYALVEFDAMPLRIQAAFWLGAIRSKLLPIRSLVYSGGKSIHGLLRLKDDEPFAAQWRLLERTLADDADPTYRCDLACRNPGRMTRFPGALRPETGKRQALLYLAC